MGGQSVAMSSDAFTKATLEAEDLKADSWALGWGMGGNMCVIC